MPTTMTQKKKAEIDFFDSFGEHGGYDVFDERGYRRIVKEFLQYIPSHDRTLKIVDFGCGTGSFTSRFLDREFELYGIDLSGNSIDYAKKKYPEISFSVGDIESTEYRNETFDVVFLSGVLHHFPDFSKVIHESYRVLRKGGVVLRYDPNISNPFVWLYRCKKSPFYSSQGVTENERPLSGNEIEAVLRSCGFLEYKAYSISGITYKYLDSKFRFLILPVYNIIERLLDLKPFRDKIGSFIITYAKK